LGLGQKDLAEAAEVTESYISQLLSRKKAPPAPGRTDIYDKLGRALKLSPGELAKLAEYQRRLELKKKVAHPPAPLFKAYRELILRKCNPDTRTELLHIFEKEAFGEIERLITQKILDVAQGIAREELRSEAWLRLLAELSGRTYEQMRVAVLEFLDSDVLHVSVESCVSFLDPMIETWDIDLKTFAIEISLNPRLVPGSRKRFEFSEKTVERSTGVQPGLSKFLKDKRLSGDATEAEIQFLQSLKFHDRRPSPLYYYRELQNLRDPLHFEPPEAPRTSDSSSKMATVSRSRKSRLRS
jgi:hypothetical protein